MHIAALWVAGGREVHVCTQRGPRARGGRRRWRRRCPSIAGALQLPTFGRAFRMQAVAAWTLSECVLPEHCAAVHWVQMLLGSERLPCAVLVELDDIQRRLLASSPASGGGAAGDATCRESRGLEDENAELTAWREARGPAQPRVLPNVPWWIPRNTRLPSPRRRRLRSLVHVPCCLAGIRRGKGAGGRCLSAQG